MEVRDLFESMDYGAAPEADDRARAWLEQRKGILDHYIAGRWRTPDSGEYFQTRNPSGGELLAMVADGNEADVNRAVAAYERYSKLLESDRAAGRKALLEIVAGVKGDREKSEQLIRLSIAVGRADQQFSARERSVVEDICQALGLHPADLGVYDL